MSERNFSRRRRSMHFRPSGGLGKGQPQRTDRDAIQARDRLGKIMAVGVVALLFSHVFINIGMNIRIVPVTGIPLPLLSYGGSSVLVSLIAIGILQNVYMYRKAY